MGYRMNFPLVCVNGVVPPELTFARLAGDVTERPVRLHDLVGYRETLPAGYGIDAELSALGAVVDGGAHLLGYSAGASVTLAFAAAHPDRIASLTLIEPPWIGAWDGTEFQAGMDTVMLDTPPDRRWETFHHLLTRPGADVPPPPPNPPAWAAGRVARGEQVWRALRVHPIPAERLRSITAPVYLPVAADSHPWFTDAARSLAERFVSANVEIYPGNHVRPPHVAEAERFVAALRSLWAAAGDPAAA
jgi:pimeloyl-ACP methyl ester carboxylesterase